MQLGFEFDADLIRRYDRAGPRYTSYPTADRFASDFEPADYQGRAAASNAGRPPRPLSLYFHLPFCNTVCFYCACNKVVTKDRSRAVPYLEYLERELVMQGELFDNGRSVEQLHWGGGTPTFLSDSLMQRLMESTARHFHLLDDDRGEYSIEVDPREADAGTIATLRGLGFNRLSLGVQDLDPRVQRAVNRMQSEQQTFAVMEAARAAGFRSISVDLIYGLPQQSAQSFVRTVDRVLQARPDRLSVFNYAHLPERFKPQRRIQDADLPSAAEKLRILQATIERLLDAGYVYIGMDHFALPEDELARAQRDGRLYRNFQGYSTHADCDLVALGITAIGSVADSFSQNVRTLDEYYARLDAGRLPVLRGYVLTDDDRLRRDVIMQLICHFELAFADIEERHGVTFADYFAAELEQLQRFRDDGLVELDAEAVRVTPAGRMLIRNVCMLFDRHLQQDRERKTRFSRVI